MASRKEGTEREGRTPTTPWSALVRRVPAVASATALLSASLLLGSVGTGCKRVQSNETLILNTRIGFVNTRCGRQAPWFSQQWCAIPDATLRALAHTVAGLAVPQPLRHMELGIDFAEQPVENFAKLGQTFGNGTSLTSVVPVPGQYYRLTDFHGPGIQALAGTELLGTRLPATWVGAWAALSATAQRLEFPKFAVATFLDMVTPGKPQSVGVRLVKEIVATDLVPLEPVSVDAVSRKATRTAKDEALHAKRYELLQPGDILLVLERVATTTVTQGNTAGAQAPRVKDLVAGGEEGIGNPKPCLDGRKLVHVAVLVEKDVWFETVLAPQASLFRLALLDDIAAHAQVLAGKPLGNLCFVVARKAPAQQGAAATFPLASQLGGAAQVLEGYALAPVPASALARAFDAPVAGRVALVAPVGKSGPLRLVPPQGAVVAPQGAQAPVPQGAQPAAGANATSPTAR